MELKKVMYKVQCCKNPEHIFDKVYEIEKGSENETTEKQVYCPFCDELVTIEIKGKTPEDVYYNRIVKDDTL